MCEKFTGLKEQKREKMATGRHSPQQQHRTRTEHTNQSTSEAVHILPYLLIVINRYPISYMETTKLTTTNETSAELCYIYGKIQIYHIF